MTAAEPVSATPMSVTEAAACGVPALVRRAESGEAVQVTKRGQTVAYVISAEHLRSIERLEAHLREIALPLMRAATDSGHRRPLDEALVEFGFSRAELEAELDGE